VLLTVERPRLLRGGKVGQVQRRDNQDGSALGCLIKEFGQAARSGWPQTARLIALIVVAAGAVAFVLACSR
jgi:hypothetical protein